MIWFFNESNHSFENDQVQRQDKKWVKKQLISNKNFEKPSESPKKTIVQNPLKNNSMEVSMEAKYKETRKKKKRERPSLNHISILSDKMQRIQLTFAQIG